MYTALLLYTYNLVVCVYVHDKHVYTHLYVLTCISAYRVPVCHVYRSIGTYVTRYII